MLTARLNLARSICNEAAEITRSYFLAPRVEITLKADATPVTEADRNAEMRLRERIIAAFPDDGILGEEFGERPGSSGYRWLLDPLDGTKSFVRGVPLFGTLIGVEFQSEMVIGVVTMPMLDEHLFASKGGGAWWIRPGNTAPQPAKMSSVSDLSSAAVCTTSPSYYRKTQQMAIYDAICKKSAMVRGWSDCYAFVLLATGRVDIAIEPYMNPWDSAPFKILVEEAGGTFTDFNGVPTIYNVSALASNPVLHEQMLSILKKH